MSIFQYSPYQTTGNNFPRFWLLIPLLSFYLLFLDFSSIEALQLEPLKAYSSNFSLNLYPQIWDGTQTSFESGKFSPLNQTCHVNQTYCFLLLPLSPVHSTVLSQESNIVTSLLSDTDWLPAYFFDWLQFQAPSTQPPFSCFCLKVFA